MMDFEFELEQGGVVVAAVNAPTREEALREINHYAAVYGQDGPVKIREKPSRPQQANE